MATDFGYPLSPRFAIHPRPFDRLLATALEIFTRAPAGKENEELALVAEYLAFFLDGPFNAPQACRDGDALYLTSIYRSSLSTQTTRYSGDRGRFCAKASVSLIGSLPISHRRLKGRRHLVRSGFSETIDLRSAEGAPHHEDFRSLK